MTEAARQIAQCRAEADAAWAGAIETVGQLRHRLDPRVVAQETAENAMAKANHLLESTAERAKSRPWLLAVGAVLLGLAVASRVRSKHRDQEATNVRDDR